MATEAQVEANRANAQKSTGPRTPEGKATVAQNAVKHGLLARAMILQGEDPQEFAEYREQMLNELYPDGMMEEELADRIVSLSWRLKRAARSQNAAFEALYDKYRADSPAVVGPAEERPSVNPDEPACDGSMVGRLLAEDFAGERVLERLLMYERRIESSLYRTMAELRKLRGQTRRSARVSHVREEPLIPDTHPIWGRSPTRNPQPAWKPGREADSPQAERLKAILDEAALLAAEADDIAAMDLPQGPEQLCQTNPICGSPRGTGIPSASLSGQALPVNQDHGQACPEPCERDAHAAALPVGVGANASQVQEQTRQTKPIGACADQGQAGYIPVFRRRS